MTTEYKAPTIDYSKLGSSMAADAERRFKEDVLKKLDEMQKSIDALTKAVNKKG